MIRYWCETSLRYIECEVVYAGRGAMPHELANAPYWRQRCALLGQGDGSGLPTGKEQKAMTAKAGPSEWETRQRSEGNRPQQKVLAIKRCQCGRKMSRQSVQCMRCFRGQRRKVA